MPWAWWRTLVLYQKGLILRFRLMRRAEWSESIRNARRPIILIECFWSPEYAILSWKRPKNLHKQMKNGNKQFKTISNRNHFLNKRMYWFHWWRTEITSIFKPNYSVVNHLKNVIYFFIYLHFTCNNPTDSFITSALNSFTTSGKILKQIK